jgi:hypothetical protein
MNGQCSALIDSDVGVAAASTCRYCHDPIQQVGYLDASDPRLPPVTTSAWLYVADGVGSAICSAGPASQRDPTAGIARRSATARPPGRAAAPRSRTHSRRLGKARVSKGVGFVQQGGARRGSDVVRPPPLKAARDGFGSGTWRAAVPRL